MLFVSRSALGEKSRTHQGRQSQRNQTRSENSNDDRDGELSKNSAEQTGHENQWDKDRRQREGHRENGERDFTGAIERGAINRFSVLRTTNDVFQKYDRVIDEKSDRQGHRHQREVVD